MGVKFNPFTSKLDIVDSPSGEFSDIELALGTQSAPSLSFTGDPNTGIYSPGADQLALTTAGSERLRIDSSGRLLVGTSSSAGGGYFFQVAQSGGANAEFLANNATAGAGSALLLSRSRGTAASPTFVFNNDTAGIIAFRAYGSAGYNSLASISAQAEANVNDGDSPGRLVFSTTADSASSPTERMRISNGGTLYTFVSGTAGNYFATNQAAGTTATLIRGAHSATANALDGTECFKVFSNGNVVNTNNSYLGISDIKLKENIVDANSQWNDLKALQVRNYNLKEGQTHTQIGLVAQEAELVSPGLVSESPDRDADGNDLGTVTKSVNYSVLYMKAVKALQEAMERIETLEQRLNDAGIA